MNPIYTMPKDKFDRMCRLLSWYDAMPANLEVGNQFHEKLSEAIDEDLPELPDGLYYSCSPSVKADGRVMVEVMFEDGRDDAFEVEIVSTNKEIE